MVWPWPDEEIRGLTRERDLADEECARLRAESVRLRDALVGLVLNVRAHRYGRCPGITAADCLEMIYEATEVAARVDPSLSEGSGQ